LWLFYYEQLSITEIALRLNTSVAAVKDRLYQSRKKLREQLEPLYAPISITHRLPVASPIAKHEVKQGAKDERRSGMIKSGKAKSGKIKISVVHSFAVEETDHYIVYLTDIEGRRILPIWVGLYEGHQIAQSLQEGETARPMTYHLMANLLKGLGAEVQEVRIEELKDNTFYAVIKAQNGDMVQELDARPSDAIALALHMDSPVFVSDALMEKVAQSLPEPWDEKRGPEELHRSIQQRGSKEWQRKIEESTAFTTRGQQVWPQMEAEALRLNHNYIGTEHLLLALVSDQESTSVQVLRALGVDPKQISEAVMRLVGQGHQAPSTQPIIVPRMVKVVEYSLEAKNELAHPALGTGHFLLGLAREGQGMAITILRSFNVDPEQLRAKTLELLSMR
jgi:bifunctional DNase/RNase